MGKEAKSFHKTVHLIEGHIFEKFLGKDFYPKIEYLYQGNMICKEAVCY